jgi:hypothetical protein
MKLRKLAAFLFACLFALLSTGAVRAQTAYQTAFTTSITYSNVGAGAASITITYYSESSGAGIPVTMASLPAGASSSVSVGTVSAVGSSFKGAAVLSSDQPIVATLVQVPAGTSPVKNRPLSNGFQSGASRVLLATVLKAKFNTTTVFSVQNAGSAPATFTVKLYNADNTTAPAITLPTVTNLPVGTTKYFDLGTIATVPAGFNGSAVIEGTGVSLVATALELSTTGLAASAFEGVTSGANKAYMASALCNFSVAGKLVNSAYAIQNVGTTATVATVLFSSGKSFVTPSIPANGKFSVQGCFGGNANAYSGSATITASAGGQIVAIGKVTGGGLSSAFLGESAGSSKLALPYARWSETLYSTGARQRTFITIQNIGAAALPAGSVSVRYYNAAGQLVGTHTIADGFAVGQKRNSTPHELGAAGNEFGYVGGFGGGAQVVGPAGSQLIAVARVQTFIPGDGTTAGEDYNGIAIQ